MQLMSDVLTVLGSRHGLFIEPNARKCHVVRHGVFPGIPCQIRAGLTVNGATFFLPLCAEGDLFAFHDQDMTPCTLKLTGIHPDTATKLELTVRIPFRPRDAVFSTTPVIDLELCARPLGANYRWQQSVPIKGMGEIFLEISSPGFSEQVSGKHEIHWRTNLTAPEDQAVGVPAQADPAVMHDALIAHRGIVDGTRLTSRFRDGDLENASIHASWCTYSEPAMRIRGIAAPFKYTDQFRNLDAVTAWAHSHPRAVANNAEIVDGIFGRHNLAPSVGNLMANSLHSWLANTWWVLDGGKDAFSVWEGSCYYHSTVDVEYTQTPFYLSVWPELLGIELDQWPDFTVDGAAMLGEKAAGTLVFMHDMGQMCEIDTTRYDHPMPVEENSNYILMSYAYWRRSGDDSRVRRHADTIRRALEFIAACDTTGNGVPDKGMANTIDDASLAVQFGKEQIYLAVKAMAAFDVGTEMLRHAGLKADFSGNAAAIAGVIDRNGWLKDHFVTLLDKSGGGVINSWNNAEMQDDVIPGWDAAHIYTANGIVLLDMLGRKVDLDEDRLRQDLRVATERCLDKYGCRHSEHGGSANSYAEGIGEGGVGMPTGRIGWVSMNMLRDMAAFYRGVDLRALSERYWQFQVLTNTQGPHAFFETFNGNNLMCYPRGIAVFGYFEALAGARIDRVAGKFSVNPLSDQIRVPLPAFADWETGRVPLVQDGKILDPPSGMSTD